MRKGGFTVHTMICVLCIGKHKEDQYMTGFIAIVFLFNMAFALLPISFVICSSVCEYTAFKYDLAFLVVSAVLYASLYIFEAIAIKNITEASIVRMTCISVIGALVAIASFGIFNYIMMKEIKQFI